MTQVANDTIRKAVRDRYGKVAESGTAGCGCSPSCCDAASTDAKVTTLGLGYSTTDVNEVPDGANMGLGCGNPNAIASLKRGETVLDLGSGGGFDCFLALKAVGETGQVIGVDMTSEMVSKARKNAESLGQGNIDFRLGEIENLPVADATVDVILSNCVINLSPDKSKVFQEAFRVLKPGGRLAISDIVATAELPAHLKNDMALLTGCISGAATITDIEEMLADRGFEQIAVRPKDESKDFIQNWVPGSNIEEYVISASIEALKPGA